MRLNELVLMKLKENNNVITTKEFQMLGLSKTMLKKYVNEGLLDKVRHGVYIHHEEFHDEIYTLSLKSNNIVFSHDTAAFLNGFSNRIPFSYSVTISKDKTIPTTIKKECMSFYVSDDFFDLGVVELETQFGNRVKTYNIERTICDMVRSSKRMEKEFVLDVIKGYVSKGDLNLSLLFEYAKVFKVEDVIRCYMEVLL